MPYKRLWLLDNRVCFIAFADVISLDDIRQISLQHEEYVAQANPVAEIHYIVDALQAITYPRNARSIQQHLVGRMPRTGWVVLVTDDFFIKHLGNIFSKMLGFQAKTVQTILDGYRFLQEVDEIPAPQSWPADLNDTMPVYWH